MVDYNPFVIARRLGLNVPDVTMQDLAGLLPGAGMSDSQQMGNQMAQERAVGNYGNAALYGLGAAGMAGSEWLPGMLGSTARTAIRGGGKGLLRGSDYTSAAGSSARY